MNNSISRNIFPVIRPCRAARFLINPICDGDQSIGSFPEPKFSRHRRNFFARPSRVRKSIPQNRQLNGNSALLICSPRRGHDTFSGRSHNICRVLEVKTGVYFHYCSKTWLVTPTAAAAGSTCTASARLRSTFPGILFPRLNLQN